MSSKFTAYCDYQIGYRITFDNGWSVSVVWGSGTYSDRRFDRQHPGMGTVQYSSSTAEVAVIDPKGNFSGPHKFPYTNPHKSITDEFGLTSDSKVSVVVGDDGICGWCDSDCLLVIMNAVQMFPRMEQTVSGSLE